MLRPLCGIPGLSVSLRCDSAGTVQVICKSDLAPQTDIRLASAQPPFSINVWLSDRTDGQALTATAADSITLGTGSALTVNTANKAVSFSTDGTGRGSVFISSAAKVPYFIGIASPFGSIVSPAPLAVTDYAP